MSNIPDIVGQYREGDSFVHRLDPRTKIISLLILSGVIFYLKSLPGCLAFAGGSVLLLWLGRIAILPRRWL